MRAVVYRQTGDVDVLQVIEKTEPAVSSGEVLVKIAVSGVNPTDWKSRRGARAGDPPAFDEVVPNQDGSGTIIDVGAGVDKGRIGERVWIWEAAYQRANGTAQEIISLPHHQALPLPEWASWELGASLGIPALTAHRCLTLYEGTSGSLSPGSLEGKVVLVSGGAGAVGHAAIELARWAGASVITTVSSKEKETYALAAGAHHVINYRSQDVASLIKSIYPSGVDIVVEVAPCANSRLDELVAAPNSVVAVYANDSDSMSVPVRPSMMINRRIHFVMVYSIPRVAKARAVKDVQAALWDGVFRVGAESGLPLHYFSLEEAAMAHQAVENKTVGKVLINVDI